MLKVAFITDKLLAGGKERRLVSVICGLISRGNVSPILILWDGVNSDDSIFYKTAIDLDIPLYYLGNGSNVSKSGKICDILKKERVDAINTWAPPFYSYYLLYAQISLGIPVYNSSITGASDRYDFKQKFIGHSLHLISRVVNSNSERAMEVFGIPRSKRKVIYNGFEFSRIEKLKSADSVRQGFDIKTTYIVSMAGRYSKAKDWPTHIKAAISILDRGYDVTFICMGAGDATSYKSLIPVKYKDRIRFIGCQTDVESILAASDIVTLASFGEGISNSILEGMAVAKPIVATDCGGNPEIVEEGKCGYLTPICDSVSYADRIIQLLDNAELRKSMGAAGLSIVKNKFGFEHMIDEFENMFLNDK